MEKSALVIVSYIHEYGTFVCAHTCGCRTTLTGAVEGWPPATAAGPRGLARCRKESGLAMLGSGESSRLVGV
jgi:hypothetical protein